MANERKKGVANDTKRGWQMTQKRGWQMHGWQIYYHRSTAVINDGIIVTCMNLNVEEELERPGDRFTCCLTNVSQGRAGISLMSTRLATGGRSTLASHHRHRLLLQCQLNQGATNSHPATLINQLPTSSLC